MTSIDSAPGPAGVPSLRHNALWSLGGNAVYAISQWCLLAAIAHLGTAHHVGVFSLALAISAPVMLCTNLQLGGLIATDVRDEFKFGHYAAIRLSTLSIGMAAIATIGFIAGQDGEEIAVVIALGWCKCIEGAAEVVLGTLQRHERMRDVARSLGSRGILGLLGLVGGLALTGTLLGGVLCMSGGWLAVLLLHDLPLAKKLTGKNGLHPMWDQRLLRRLLLSAGPMGAVALLVSLNATIPSYVIRGTHGAEALGHFSVVAYLMAAGNIAVGALGSTVSPRLALLYAKGDITAFSALVKRITIINVAIGLAGAALGWLLGRQILTIAYGAEYAGQQDLLLWLIAASTVGWIASASGYALTAARQLTIQLPLTLPATLACGLACLLLVPQHGLIGAAWALLAMSSVLAASNVTALIYTIRRMRISAATGLSP